MPPPGHGFLERERGPADTPASEYRRPSAFLGGGEGVGARRRPQLWRPGRTDRGDAPHPGGGEALGRRAAVPARPELLHAAAGPRGPATGHLHRLADAPDRRSPTQRFSSTRMRCITAICPAGPPKLRAATRAHTLAASAKLTPWASLAGDLEIWSTHALHLARTEDRAWERDLGGGPPVRAPAWPGGGNLAHGQAEAKLAQSTFACMT